MIADTENSDIKMNFKPWLYRLDYWAKGSMWLKSRALSFKWTLSA